jgi:hypothetical protein
VAAVNPYIRFSGHESAPSPASPAVGPPADRGKGLYTSLDFSAQSMDQATLNCFLHGLSPTLVPSSLGLAPTAPLHTHPLTSPLDYPLTPYPFNPSSSFQQPIVFLPPPPFQIATEYPPRPPSYTLPTYDPTTPPLRKLSVSGGNLPRYHPYPPKTQTGFIRGLSPAQSPPSSPARSTLLLGENALQFLK